jgi:hypothetical protein
MKFVYVTKDTAETSVKNCIYHYTTHEMVICDSDGMIGDHISHS